VIGLESDGLSILFVWDSTQFSLCLVSFKWAFFTIFPSVSTVASCMGTNPETGGAWIIGYKAWGTLLGQQLVERDIIVVCIDYRNFPQGCISNMVSDVTTGIGYVIQNVGSYGGDADRIFLAGQSAGAHLAACSLIMQAKKRIL
jgi:hypothetical protein